MVTAQSGGGEEEEGAIADPSTDLLDNSYDKLKVSTLIIHSTQMSIGALCVAQILWLLTSQ